MMKSTLLSVNDLYVNFDVYGGALKVLNGLYLTLKEGEKIGLVGETGCGKTTTAKSIMRILPEPPAKITGGEILFNGKDVLRMSEKDINIYYHW